MKKNLLHIATYILTVVALSTLPMDIMAQQPHRRGTNSWRNEYHTLTGRKVDMSVLTLNLRHPGELAKQLRPEERNTVTTIVLDGAINDADIRVLTDLAKRKTVIVRGKERKAFLDIDLENVRYYDGRQFSDRLPDNAFRDCPTLRSVVLPFRLRALGNRVFANCPRLEVVAMPDNLEVLGKGVFYGCESLISIYIPDNVRVIPEQAFYNCSALKEVSMPEGVEVIGPKAFYSTSLTSAPLPRTVRSVEKEAFANCHISRAIFPAWLPYCDAHAFDNGGLVEYVVEEGNAQYSSRDGMLYSLDGRELIAYPANRKGTCVIPADVVSVRGDAFRGNHNVEEVVMECRLNGLGQAMFKDCTALRSVTLPEGMVVIGKEAFRGCKALTHIAMPQSLTRIDEEAFRACKGMTAIQLPPALEVIGEAAFDYCTKLQEISVPATVKRIDNKAFYNCDVMTHIVMQGSVPPASTGKINDNLKKIILVVPSGSADAYRSAAGWNKFKNIQ